MRNVYYKRIIEGQTVPTVIHNGGYYYIDMAVYEDGSVSCWDRIGLDDLEQKLEEGRLVTEIPAGEVLSIHGLGAYKIERAQWLHTKESFVKHIHDLVRQMNPAMEGLYKETSLQRERWNQQRVCFSATPIPYKFKGNFGYNMLDGLPTHLFYSFLQEPDGWQLTTLTAFPDKTIAVDSLPGQWLSLDEVNRMFESGTLKSSLGAESTILIEGFSIITIADPLYPVEDLDKRLEIADMVAEAAGEETSLKHCRSVYEEYLEQPAEESRLRLKHAYEAIPEHQRMYLGDMDSKDYDYRRIIYEGEEEL